MCHGSFAALQIVLRGIGLYRLMPLDPFAAAKGRGAHGQSNVSSAICRFSPSLKVHWVRAGPCGLVRCWRLFFFFWGGGGGALWRCCGQARLLATRRLGYGFVVAMM